MTPAPCRLKMLFLPACRCPLLVLACCLLTLVAAADSTVLMQAVAACYSPSTQHPSPTQQAEDDDDQFVPTEDGACKRADRPAHAARRGVAGQASAGLPVSSQVLARVALPGSEHGSRNGIGAPLLC